MRTIAGRWTVSPLSFEAVLRAGCAVALLLAGALVYEFARPGGWHGTIADAAPTFLHVFALALLCVAALRPSRGATVAWCAFWVGVNALFELGQQAAIAPSLASAIEANCSAPACEATARYFMRGTFDPLDLAAAGLGGVAAWIALGATRVRAP